MLYLKMKMVIELFFWGIIVFLECGFLLSCSDKGLNIVKCLNK